MNNETIIKELKQEVFKINSCLSGISKNYYTIAEKLYNIKSKFYIEQTKYKGYTSITDFAENEFGFDKSKTSRLISIYEKFFINKPVGFYQEFKYYHLVEMLTMSDEQIKLCKPEMTVNEIKQIKSKELLRSNSEQGENIDNSINNNVIDGIFPDKKEEPEESKTTTIIVTELPQSPPRENKTITIDVKTESEQNNSFVSNDSEDKFRKLFDEKTELQYKIIQMNEEIQVLQDNIANETNKTLHYKNKFQEQQETIKYFYNELFKIISVVNNDKLQKFALEFSEFVNNYKLPQKVNFFKNVV